MPPHPPQYTQSDIFLTYWSTFIALQCNEKIYTGDDSEEEYGELDSLREDIRNALLSRMDIEAKTAESIRDMEALEWLLGLFVVWHRGRMNGPIRHPDSSISWTKDIEILQTIRDYGTTSSFHIDNEAVRKFLRKHIAENMTRSNHEQAPTANEQLNLLKERIRIDGYSNENRILLSKFMEEIKQSGNTLLHIEIETYKNNLDMNHEIESEAMKDYARWSNENGKASDKECREKWSEFQEKARHRVRVEKAAQSLAEKRRNDPAKDNAQEPIYVPLSFFQGRSPQIARDAMRAEYGDAVIAYILREKLKQKKTEIGRLLWPRDEWPTDRALRDRVDKLIKQANGMEIIIGEPPEE